MQKHHPPFFALLTVMLALLSSNPAEGQSINGVKGKADTYWSRSQKIGFGLRAGPNVTLATITDKAAKPLFGTLPKSGFSIAGVMTMPLKENYSFYSELGYLRSGRIMKIIEMDWQSDFTYNFITTSMGLRRAVNIRLRDNLKGEIFLSVGPNINYLMGGKGKLITPGNDMDFDLEFNNYDEAQWGDFTRNFINDPNRFLFGIDMGIGGEAPLSDRQKLFAEFRFTWGHTNLGTRETVNKLEVLNYDDTLLCNLKTFSFNLIYTYTYDRRQSKQGKSTIRQPNRKPRRR